mmetsp:Transcript_70695/g.187909  ORF Transcript_70695/g.187909 Transcript_70695/m.187909 type:complete len:239 (+) Transcript_70695:1133-1849(+)
MPTLQVRGSSFRTTSTAPPTALRRPASMRFAASTSVRSSWTTSRAASGSPPPRPRRSSASSAPCPPPRATPRCRQASSGASRRWPSTTAGTCRSTAASWGSGCTTPARASAPTRTSRGRRPRGAPRSGRLLPVRGPRPRRRRWRSTSRPRPSAARRSPRAPTARACARPCGRWRRSSSTHRPRGGMKRQPAASSRLHAPSLPSTWPCGRARCWPRQCPWHWRWQRCCGRHVRRVGFTS